MTDTISLLPLEAMPLREITQDHGEAGLLARLDRELESTDWDIETRTRVNAALEIALEAHKDDLRGEYPYSTHFLRVTVRILSPRHFNIRDQPALIIAALLHDTVEDHAAFYTGDNSDNEITPEAQVRALHIIEQTFDEEVAHYIGAVTNPKFPTDISRAQKNALYQEHVKELLLSEPLAGIIKLSDFIDNCVGLLYNEDPEKALRLANKYQPLIPAMKDFVLLSPYFTDSMRDHLVAQLDGADRRCNELRSAKEPS